MIFAAPWAFIGLASLPVLWWLYVRRRKPPVVDTPSLMFVLDEEEQARLPRGRRFDWELFLTLAAAALLTLAATGPHWQSERAHRVVRVVVAGGALATRKGYEKSVSETLDAMGVALEPGDQLDVRWVPARDHDFWEGAPRPSLDSLLSVARAGSATVRYIINDQLPDESTADIVWIALGDPDAANAGIVGVRVMGTGSEARLHVVVERNAVDQALAITMHALNESPTPLRPGTGTAATVEIPFDTAIPEQHVSLYWLDDDPQDVLENDNAVTLSARRLSVWLAPELPLEVARSLRAALHAARGEGIEFVAAVAQADLVIGAQRPANAAWFLGLTLASADAPSIPLPAGDDIVTSSRFTRDVDLDGTAWRFPSEPPVVDESALLLGRVVRGRTWPVLIREGQSGIRLLALPPDARAPFWPMWIENVLDTFPGHHVGGGFRALGVLDGSVTRIGRDVQPFNEAALRAVPADRNASRIDLRVPLLILGLLAALLLWALPVFRRSQNAATPAYAQ